MSSILESASFFRLRGVLEACDWRVDDHKIASALPHFIDKLAAVDTITALQNLDIDVNAHPCNLKVIRNTDCPALFLTTDGRLMSLLEHKADRYLVHRDESIFPKWEKLGPQNGTLITLKQRDAEQEAQDRSKDREVAGFKRHLSGLAPNLYVVFFAALVTNFLAFAPPLFIMVLYDRVIPSGSQDLLFALILGMGLVISTDIALRLLRNKVISLVGADVDQFMGNLLFRKLMSLPLEQLTKSDIDQQFNRLKQFESLRDAFTGPTLVSLFDLPFTLVFGALIFFISPVLGFCILGTAIAFLISHLLLGPIQQKRQSTAATSRLALQNLQTELLSNQRAIARFGVKKLWIDRVAQRASVASDDTRAAKEITLAMQAVGQSLMMFAGAMTILIGALGVINETLTLGGLVASMALVWRVLSPLQSLYGSSTQIKGHRRSISQIERIAKLPEEMRSGIWQSQAKIQSGVVELDNISFRYQPTGDPVVAGITLSAKPGQITVVSGLNAAGKSTILRMFANLYTPMSGALRIDGMDVRQIPVDDLRDRVSFAPQEPEFFFGTIAQNFRMNNILASDEEIWTAIKSVGLLAEVQSFERGIETQMNDAFMARVSPSVLKALNVARALVKDASIYVFDEPSNGLDAKLDREILKCLIKLKEKHTVVISTRFAHHLELADQAIFLAEGRVSLKGAGREVMSQLDSQGHAKVLQ